MGSKTRLSSYCTKRANNGVNLVTSRKINTRLAHPIEGTIFIGLKVVAQDVISLQYFVYDEKSDHVGWA